MDDPLIAKACHLSFFILGENWPTFMRCIFPESSIPYPNTIDIPIPGELDVDHLIESQSITYEQSYDPCMYITRYSGRFHIGVIGFRTHMFRRLSDPMMQTYLRSLDLLYPSLDLLKHVDIE